MWLSFVVELLTGKRFLALRCAVVIGAGIALGLSLPQEVGLGVLGVLRVLRVLLVLRVWWIALILAALSIIPVILLSERFLYFTMLFLAVSYGRVSLPSSVTGDLYDMPLKIEGQLAGKTGSYSILNIEEPQGLKGRKVLIYLTRDEELGTSFNIQGRLLALAFPRNPGVPNRNQRLEREGVIGRISADHVQVTSPPQGIRAWLNKTRKSLIRRNKELFGEEAALYTAILLGERSEVGKDLYLDMKRTGTLHLLAVSGLHVGVLVGFLFLLLRLFRTPRWLMLPLLALMLCFYIALVGPRASIIRASVMSLAVAACRSAEGCWRRISNHRLWNNRRRYR